MIRDYQRSACYAWEDRHIHPNDRGTVPFGQAQAIVDYVWRTAGLAHPPKMRPLAPTARNLHATATRLWISIPKAGIKSTVLLHEIAHSMTSDAFGEHWPSSPTLHGPRRRTDRTGPETVGSGRPIYLKKARWHEYGRRLTPSASAQE